MFSRITVTSKTFIKYSVYCKAKSRTNQIVEPNEIHTKTFLLIKVVINITYI